MADSDCVAVGSDGAELRGHGMVPAIPFIPRTDKLPEAVKSTKDAARVAVTVVCGAKQ